MAKRYQSIEWDYYTCFIFCLWSTICICSYFKLLLICFAISILIRNEKHHMRYAVFPWCNKKKYQYRMTILFHSILLFLNTVNKSCSHFLRGNFQKDSLYTENVSWNLKRQVLASTRQILQKENWTFSSSFNFVREAVILGKSTFTLLIETINYRNKSSIGDL